MIPKEILQTIKRSKTFLVTTHVNPDPDAICSELVFASYLRGLGKKVDIVNCEKISPRFSFLPGIKDVKRFDAFKKKKEFDAAVILDCGEFNRIGKVEKLIDKKMTIINIDHHITNDAFGDINLIKPEASSTAEILHDLLIQLGWRMNKNLALNIYLGIMTDTGSFRYENTTAKTHRVVAGLMDYKLSANDLYRRFYETIPLNDLKLFAKIISRFLTYEDGKIAVVSLTKKELRKFSGEFDLRDAVFKMLRAVKEVEAVIILTEVDRRKTRINLRSCRYVDVAKVASMFRGGGHKRASGCMIHKNIKSAKSEIIDAIRKLL